MTNGTHRDVLLLERLIEHLQYAHADVSQFKDSEALARSRRDQNSASKEIELAQECAKELSKNTINRFPSVRWKELRGLRNVIVHEYGELDWDVLYDTVMIDFPPMIETLKKVQQE
ncbi:MAG: DUF86 domain-containing protein [Bifidobacteriaceae bacterium]|jgi:uncharacterized protein with HEPN domain|nr:DUF86 domain-containing protein [Bifidobacteriaceae bacterium]